MSFFKKLLDWGFFGNTWCWFHQLGGAVGARVGLVFFSPLEVLVGMFVLVMAWETIEVIYEGIDGLIKIYGSLERWFYDSLGDVLGAMIMVILITGV